jgi:hypothetical protein
VTQTRCSSRLCNRACRFRSASVMPPWRLALISALISTIGVAESMGDHGHQVHVSSNGHLKLLHTSKMFYIFRCGGYLPVAAAHTGTER